MKLSVIFFLFVTINTLQAEGWNNIITTNINAQYANKLDLLTNKNGNHIVVTKLNEYIKYYLVNTSGEVVRTQTLDNDGDFPNVVGNNDTVFVVYKKSNFIKVLFSIDAGVSWSDEIGSFEISDFYCNGVDAAYNGWGIHIVWATNENRNYETYYKRWDGSDWLSHEEVTEEEEYGGMPSITSSANKIHVSYNTGEGMDPSDNEGQIKTRDKNFTTSLWEDPQDVFQGRPFLSKVERLFCDGNYLHLFYCDAQGTQEILPPA